MLPILYRFAKKCLDVQMTVLCRKSRIQQAIVTNRYVSSGMIRFQNCRNLHIGSNRHDVKPLEVLIFMRDVESLLLYIQMKGRGVRTIGDEQLRNVTPNAFSKDCFYLVDAVGVTEHEMKTHMLIDRPTTKIITLKNCWEQITHGYLPDEHLKRLAANTFQNIQQS